MAAQEILIARGEDHHRRASNASDYMLTGRVVCTHCGNRYLGTATGNKYTYRYDTCYSRYRYGSQACKAERLPAEQFDEAVIDALLASYQNVGLFEEAVAAVAERRAERWHLHEKELKVVDEESYRCCWSFRSALPRPGCGRHHRYNGPERSTARTVRR